MAASRNDVALEIRKLRKKLRQIENLERLERDLTEEEALKVSRKASIRSTLQDILSDLSSPSFDTESGDTPENLDTSDNKDLSTDSFPTSSEGDSFNTVADYSGQAEESYTEGPVIVGAGGDGVSIAASESKESSMKRISSEARDTETVPLSSPTKKKKTGNMQDTDHSQALARQWHKAKFAVQELEGHNDLVCSVDCDGGILVSGSRDTTVKVWSLETGVEIRSLGGHTGTVTSVCLLPSHASKLNAVYDLSEDDRLVVSGSQDCSIRIWSLHTGKALKSIYTYNPVTCLAYLKDMAIIVSASDGGKLEMWDPETGESVQSIRAHEEAITAVQVAGTHIYTACADGVLKVYELRDRNLRLLFESENVKGAPGVKLQWRHIRSLTVANENIYFGDDGTNIKILDWRAGVIRKLAHHTTEFGTTDAQYVYENLLISSGYDLDNGIGFLNVRSLPEEKYLCTLCDEDTGRIISLTANRSRSGKVQIITAGGELKMWEQVNTSKPVRENEAVIEAAFISQYNKKAHNSDVDSDTEFSETESESGERTWRRRGSDSSDEQTKSGWMSWCTIL